MWRLGGGRAERERLRLALALLGAHQLGHVHPGPTVGQDDRQQDEAVGGPYQHDTQVHSESKINSYQINQIKLIIYLK